MSDLGEQALTDREDPHADVSDTGRLATLEGYGVLDTSPEAGLDGIVVLARALCAVPFAMVSLVTGKGQWFKARSGFAGCETDLESSVCKHVLGRRDLLVIPDLSRDARTKGNPLVLGEPHIRFYAGAPLVTPDGHALGALCVIDTEVRPQGLTEQERDCLRILAELVMSHLELHRRLGSVHP